MYEGKNIHYSSVDQRPLCSFSGKVCKQRRLNGYALCLRHILEDASAPYKRCINRAKNGQQCSNVIPQSRETDYCNSHAHAHALDMMSHASPGAVFQSIPKQQHSNGLADPEQAKSTSLGSNHNTPTTNGPKSSTCDPSDRKKMGKDNDRVGSWFEDPYAFPSDPEPQKAQRTTSSFSSMASPFPNLSQALANLASGTKVGQPQVCDNRTEQSSTTSSMARLFPELADKLDIGKRLGKGDFPKGKTFFTSGSNKSSRTMNRLQTKIAQNKIKDKLKKSSIVSNSQNNSLSNINMKTSHETLNSSSSSTGSKQSDSVLSGNSCDPEVIDLDEDSGHSNGIINVSSPPPCNLASNTKSSAKTKPRSRSGKQSSSKSKSPRAKSELIVRPIGQFPTLESHLQQTSPIVNPWLAQNLGVLPSSSLALTPTQLQALPHQMAAHGLPLLQNPAYSNPLSISSVNSDLSRLCRAVSQPAVCHTVSAAMGSVPSLSQTLPVSLIPTIDPRLLSQQQQNQPQVPSDTVLQSQPHPESTPKCSTEKEEKVQLLEPKIEIDPQATAKDAAIQDVISGTKERTMKVRQYKSHIDMVQVKKRVKRHSALEFVKLREKRRKANFNMIPMGVDSSEDNVSDVEEVFPWQREWLISSESETEDEDFQDDPLLANIRHTKQMILQSKLRRQYTQTQKSFTGNTCLWSSRVKDLHVLAKASRIDPSCAAEAAKVTLKLPDKSAGRLYSQRLLNLRPCLCKGDKDKICAAPALPFTNQCGKHIMYNVDQQLYDYCTAKFSDNTQCCVPVFDIKHELPLCPEHAAKADNYQKNLEANRPKKLRKKTKPSALTRPPRKGKKRKNQQKNKKGKEDGDTSSGELVKFEKPMFSDDNMDQQSGPELIVPSSPENLKDSLAHDLGNDLEESFSPGTIDKHLELPLEEHDLNEVLNKLPDDAFELFTGKNGEFENSKMEEEAAAFEHVLAETSKKMKASENLNKLNDSGRVGLMISDHNAMMGDHNLMEEHTHEDDLTKEIADSILHQNLSPTGSIVDDLGQDNISALASSLSANDLRNISQVLNASLINPVTGQDIGVPSYNSIVASLNNSSIHQPQQLPLSSHNQGPNHTQIHSQSHLHIPNHIQTPLHHPSQMHTSVQIQGQNIHTQGPISHPGQIMNTGQVLNTAQIPSTGFIQNTGIIQSTGMVQSTGQIQNPGQIHVPDRSRLHTQLLGQRPDGLGHVTEQQNTATFQYLPHSLASGLLMSPVASTSQIQNQALLNRTQGQYVSPSTQNPALHGLISGQTVPQTVSSAQSNQIVNGAPSTQSIAQILAALTASTKQFTNLPPMGGITDPGTTLQYPPVVSVDSLPQNELVHRTSTATTTQFPGLQFTTPLSGFPAPVSLSFPATIAGHMSSTSQQQPGPYKTVITPNGGGLHNGIFTLPANMASIAQQTPTMTLPMASGATQLGLKLPCPLQTLVPVSLLGSGLNQGLPQVAVATGPPTQSIGSNPSMMPLPVQGTNHQGCASTGQS